ncbi:hypothetical protein [Rummeliibacillus sp. SL167]|nr:hypothetical protein [Rummeliibacillus sp. SL167]
MSSIPPLTIIPVTLDPIPEFEQTNFSPVSSQPSLSFKSKRQKLGSLTA